MADSPKPESLESLELIVLESLVPERMELIVQSPLWYDLKLIVLETLELESLDAVNVWATQQESQDTVKDLRLFVLVLNELLPRIEKSLESLKLESLVDIQCAWRQ